MIPVALLAVVIITIALTGGSSRPNDSWLLVMRPVTIVVLVAMLLRGRIDWPAIRPLPLLLALFAGTIAIQLVPLPPAIWSALPGRDKYDAVLNMLGDAGGWHPLAISPDQALNSLAALVVPFACLAGYAALDARHRLGLLMPMLGLVAFSMLLGLAQIASGEDSLLYWHRVSGTGQMIGLLANRNHQAALLALSLPLLRAWTLMPAVARQRARTREVIAAAGGVVVLLYVLVLGSRAGLALTLVGLVAAFLVAPSIGANRLPPRLRWLLIGGTAMAILALLGLAMSLDRAESIGRLVGDDLGDEGRLRALPTLLHIVRESFPFGTGFGSFVSVFNSYEPDTLLKPTYFNNAHNDLIELAITGGLPALLVLAGFLAWWGSASWRCFTGHSVATPWRALRRAAAAGILILLLASLADYPLRAPLLGMVFTLLSCWLAQDPKTVTDNNHA